MKLIYLVAFTFAATSGLSAQLVVQNRGGIYIGKNASVTIEGDIELSAPIDGEGTVILSGASSAINANGNSISNLIVSNGNLIDLQSDLRITRSLLFMKGIMRCNDFNLDLSEEAQVSATDPGSWIETNKNGSVRKQLATEINNFQIPLGGNQGFVPVYVSARPHGPLAFIGVNAKADGSRKASGASDYLNTVWNVNLKNIAGRARVMTAYNDQLAIEGNESTLEAYTRAAHATNTTTAILNKVANHINAELSGEGGEVFATRPANADRWKMNSITLTPNPVVNVAILRFYTTQPGKRLIMISDAAGRIVCSQTITATAGSNQHRINVMGLAKGFYHLSASGLDQNFPMLKR